MATCSVCGGAMLTERPHVHEPHTYRVDCWCNAQPVMHEDDSYGACVTCREYIHHTDDEYRSVPFPCPTVRLAAAEADAAALAEALRGIDPVDHDITAIEAESALAERMRLLRLHVRLRHGGAEVACPDCAVFVEP